MDNQEKDKKPVQVASELSAWLGARMGGETWDTPL